MRVIRNVLLFWMPPSIRRGYAQSWARASMARRIADGVVVILLLAPITADLVALAFGGAATRAGAVAGAITWV